MADAPSLAILCIGRAISGMARATMAVALANISDIRPEAVRAKGFGQMGAIFGIGFMRGPILGGVLGAHWVQLPFLAAAALNALNFLFGALVVPESRNGLKDAGVPKLAFLGPVGKWLGPKGAVVLDGGGRAGLCGHGAGGAGLDGVWADAAVRAGRHGGDADLAEPWCRGGRTVSGRGR